jgi:PAS domain S-box-containing protein
MESKALDAGTLYEAIVEQAPDAIIFSDRDGAIRVWNRGAEAIFGHTAPEVLGTSLDVIIPEPLRKAHWQAFDEALESGTTKYAGRVLTTRSVHKDGSRLYVELSFALVRDAAGAIVGALAMARDCTERYLAEKARASGNVPAERTTRSP